MSPRRTNAAALRPRRWLWLAAPLGMACQSTVDITPLSSSVTDVRVRVTSSSVLGDPAFGVVRVLRVGDQKLVWEASTPEGVYLPVSEVRYGLAPAGFHDTQPAEPARSGHHLRFSVTGPGVRGKGDVLVTP